MGREINEARLDLDLYLIDFVVQFPCGQLVKGLTMPTARKIARWHRYISPRGAPQVRLRMQDPSGQQWLVPLETKHPWWVMRKYPEVT
mgnify:CR=1 FL=1